jgi:hypothetical protein
MSKELLWAEVQIVENSQCKLAYGAAVITDRKVCVSTNNGVVGACDVSSRNISERPW